MTVKKSAKMKAYRLGYIAEYIAVILLIIKGYTVIGRRYKTSAGEIDIIAFKNKQVVFVEVKARRQKNNLIDPISSRQRSRIKQTAAHFMACHKRYNNCGWRFDAIYFVPGKMPKHLQSIW